MKIIGHEIMWKILEFILNSIEKVKPVCLLSCVCFLNQTRQNPPKLRYFADQTGAKRRPHKNKF